MSKDLEERIRFILDLFLPEVVDFQIAQSERDWTKMIESCKEIFDNIPIAIFKSENIENKEITYEFFDNLCKSPYHIILNKYLFLLFDNFLDWPDDFFDLRIETYLSAIINDNVDKSIICVISNKCYFQTLNKIKDLAIKQRLQEIENQSIDELYRHGIPITTETIKQMIIKKVNEIKM